MTITPCKRASCDFTTLNTPPSYLTRLYYPIRHSNQVTYHPLLSACISVSLQLSTLISADFTNVRSQFTVQALTLRIKLSSGCSSRSMDACLTVRSNSMSRLRGTSSAGKRSPISPMNTGTSSVMILGTLKSRRARISTSSSGLPGSPR